MDEYGPHDPRKGLPGQEQAGMTELEEDGRGDDAEQVPDAQAEQSLREASLDEDTDAAEDAARHDRND